MSRAVTLAIAGDVMLGRLVDRVITQKGFAYPWGNMLPVLNKADLVLINLECTLTSHTKQWHDGGYKPFYFRAEPSVVETLKIGRVSFACVANNHIGDFGTEGLIETLEVLDRGGIAHAGAGIDLAEARRPARLKVNGVDISIVGFADYPPAWAATPNSPGINYTPVSVDPEDFQEVESALSEARQGDDLVIFSIHWGPNLRARPTKTFRDFARRVVDAGADIFWGHSAHVVQGIEVYNRKLILYDTGDLVDDYAVDEALRNDLSALFLVKVRPPQIESLALVPVQISNRQVNLAEGKGRDWFVQQLRWLCEEMGTRPVAGPEGLSLSLASEEGKAIG